MAPAKTYDVILLGASGYTGKLTAEYMMKSFPAHVTWAIAGRTEAKLGSLISDLRKVDPAKPSPDAIVVKLNAKELDALAKRAKVILNTVGPYHLYSTPVVQACAENGTHYLDVTGETPWVHELIEKFDSVAKKTGSILIPEVGVESTPSDILAYTATKLVRDVWDCGVHDMIGSFHELKSSGVSGGTLATAIGILDHYSMKDVAKSLSNPFSLSPIIHRDHRLSQYPEPFTYTRSFWQKLTGVWSYPLLGMLTTSLTARPNQAIVHRSAGLNPSMYGYTFTYEEYMRVSSFITGFVVHAAVAFVSFILIFPPLRWILKLVVTRPGFGPSIESGKNDYFELRGVAVAQQLSDKRRKAFASFRYEGGSLYVFTAIALAEGGLALLDSVPELRKKYGGGVLTPACLGDRYVQGLQDAGIKITVKQIGDIGSK